MGAGGGKLFDFGVDPTDDDIARKVQQSLDTHNALRKYDVQVSISDATATLSGKVASAALKAQAERVVRSHRIGQISNGIVVDANVDLLLAERSATGLSKTGERITDDWIAARLKRLLDAEGLSGVVVEVNSGEVTLTGSVRLLQDRRTATNVARQVEGVLRVNADIVVAP
jgi:osmotically-inducible protein OsmY